MNVDSQQSPNFKSPTPEEVTAYALTLGYALDGGKFVDYYEARGWMIGKTRIKSWKAAVRTWKRTETESRGNRGKLAEIMAGAGKSLD